MSDKKGRIAIVPGSFDPITNGHVNIVIRAAKSYDKVYLAVMINSEKSYTFTLDERKRIADAAVGGIDGVTVISSEGYLWKLAKDLGADAIVKGVRNEIDRAYELKMAEYNYAHYPQAKTVLLETDPKYEALSSTLVRSKLESGEDISKYLPHSASELVKEIFLQKNKACSQIK